MNGGLLDRRLKLTRRQHELLSMDCYAEYKEGVGPTMEADDTPFGGTLGIQLRSELRAGKFVTVSDFLIEELREFSDRDQEPNEQRLYRRLLAKAKDGRP